MLNRMMLAVAVLSLVGGCYQDDTVGLGGDTRRPLARVLLTDAPFPYDTVAAVNIHIVSLSASETPDTSGAADWNVITEPDKAFNLLALQHGTTALVGEGELSGRLYRAIRMVIDADRSSVIWKNGSAATVHWPWPGSGQITLYALVEEPLALLADENDIEIVIDWDVGRSFLYDYYGGKEFTVIPWLRAVHSAYTGAIAGVVTTDYTGQSLPVQNASVTVYRGNPAQSPATWGTVATSHTDAAGAYRIAYVGSGTYIVRIEHAPSPFLAPVITTGVDVTIGATTTVSASLPRAGEGGAYVRISGPTSVGVGGTITLLAAVGDVTGDPIAGAAVTWWSSNPVVATVSSGSDTSSVTGLTPGSVWIYAASNGETDSVGVEVVGEPQPVASVTVLPGNATLAVGDSSGLRAELRDAGGNLVTNRPVSWYSSDTTVVAIEGFFGDQIVVRARAVGTAAVRATSDGKVGEAAVTVQ